MDCCKLLLSEHVVVVTMVVAVRTAYRGTTIVRTTYRGTAIAGGRSVTAGRSVVRRTSKCFSRRYHQHKAENESYDKPFHKINLDD